MWKYPDDYTRAVITAKETIASAHHAEELILPETAIMFFIHGGMEFMQENFNTVLLTDKFPSFLIPGPFIRWRNTIGCAFWKAAPPPCRRWTRWTRWRRCERWA